jgi:hypothetical protein
MTPPNPSSFALGPSTAGAGIAGGGTRISAAIAGTAATSVPPSTVVDSNKSRFRIAGFPQQTQRGQQ